MSRTHRKHCLDGYCITEWKPWAEKGLKGTGYEYWSRRIGYAFPGRHKYGKKKTHTFERAAERRLIHKLYHSDTIDLLISV
jgi:hypothetical protein